MSDDFLKVKKGLTLRPQSSIPSSPEDGSLVYDEVRDTVSTHTGGQWIDSTSVSTIASAANLTSTQLTASVVRSSAVAITGAISGSLHGLAATPAGRVITIMNIGTGIITIPNDSATEGTPANRILTPMGNPVIVSPGGSVQIVRDPVSDKNRALVPSAGLSTSPTYTYASFKANGIYSADTYVDGSFVTNEPMYIKNVFVVNGKSGSSGTILINVVYATNQSSPVWASIWGGAAPVITTIASNGAWKGFNDVVNGITGGNVLTAPASAVIPAKTAFSVNISGTGVGFADLTVILVLGL